MEFMHVQIPYRGGIPIINRRGPIADLELDIKTIKTLISYDIEVLDPSNGKPIAFEEEAPAPAAAPKEDKPAEKKTDEAVTTPVAAAAVKPADEKKADETAPTVTASAVAAPAAATAQEAAPSEEKAEDTAADGDDDAVEGADAFDYTKIVNYSSLSKSKRKELRKFFAEKNGKMDINILYATLNEMSKK